jgi:ubiquinone biosynthesis protein
LAERGVEIFFTQVFEHNFFHADMHPGNIFVDASQPQSPSYIGVDCAIMGSLSDFDRYYLARTLLAIFKRDYRLVAQLHVESGWVPEGTSIQAFESMIRSACEPVFEKPLSEISFGTLVVYLFQSARRFGMEVQPSLVLLQKTLLNIEGLGRELYPELNLWDTARPFLEKWMTQRYSPQQLLNDLGKQAPSLIEILPALPEMLIQTLRQNQNSPSKTGRATSAKFHNQHVRLEQALKTQQRINITLIAVAVLFVLFQN